VGLLKRLQLDDAAENNIILQDTDVSLLLDNDQRSIRTNHKRQACIIHQARKEEIRQAVS